MVYLHTTTGCKIYYEKYGQTGPIVILLHGLASSSRSWTYLIRALKEHYQVYTLDFPGHGQSDRWKTYRFDDLSELIRDWMAYCNIPTAYFVGISLGCSVALTVAVRYPEKVSALILEGPLAGYRAGWNPLGWLDWFMFGSLPLFFQGSVSLFGHRAIAHWLNTFGVKQKRNFKSLESTQSLVDFKAVRQLLWQSAYPPCIRHLHRIQAPVLLIRGKNDPIPRRFVIYIQNHLSNATLVEVPKSRHLVALEKPRKFNRLVLNFLAQIQPQA